MKVSPTSLESVVVSLEAFRDSMDERDRRYGERFKHIDAIIAEKDKFYQAVIEHLKESTLLASHESEKAVNKQEAAQKSYNETHNDLTRKMEAQGKDTIPRKETESRFSNLENMIADLRESRSQVTGEQYASKASSDTTKWLVPIIILTAFNLIGLVFAFSQLGH